MRRNLYILSAVFITLSACTKVESTRTSGTDTIDNTVYLPTYYAYGFKFSDAKLVSNLANPGADIVLYVNKDTSPFRLTLQADNLKPSFYKVGDFANEAAAITAFDNLKTVSVSQWSDMADPIKDNQVWIFRTGSEKYAKIRIVSTINETRQGIAYGECTFQWVYQPDGTATFSGK
jgi:hypothetical protein